MNGYDAQDMATQGADGFRDGYQAGYADAVKAVEAGKPAAAQEAVAYWRVTFRMYRDDPELCVLFVGGQEQPSLDSLGVTPRPLELVSVEPRFVKQHRWDQYGERCLDCGDKDWMNNPVCRQRLTDPCIEATPSIAVDPSTEVTPVSTAAPVAAAPVGLDAHGLRALDNCIRDLRRLLELADDFALDEMQMQSLETAIESMELRKVASTPAAPGFDLEQFREAVVFWRDCAVREFRYGTASEADALLALIDASPKGGSTDAKDAARWRYIRRKLCLTGNGDGTCSMQVINLPASIHGWPDPGQVSEFCDTAIDAAMQSTSAEVGS